MIAAAHQHGAGDSGGIQKKKVEFAQRKTPKGGQKERTHREGHGNSAGSVKTFQRPAMLKTTPLDCEKNATREMRGETRGLGQTRCQKQWLTQN